ncbi:MAG: AMP-binding protein, partial [Muribaculaceae bacterium]|nr:AMP-binding protein [Muribaculaceae bacterium]
MNKFVELLPAQAAHYGDREELRYRDYRSQEWTSMSWNALRVAADQAACSFAELGVEVQGRVCVFSQNCPEIFVTHFGAFGNRAIP